MIKRKQPESDKRKKYVHKKNTIGKKGGSMLYATGAAGLVLLLVFSFFAPQLIFSIRDSYLCRDIVHEKQENMDVALLGASYEPSLERRLKNFVKGQERGRDFYVSMQEMEVTPDLYEQLIGMDGLFYQQDIISVMMDMGMVSYLFLNTFKVNCWKRYVVFSDEYAEGVNFIIWYLDLEAGDGMHLELLVDAEDASVYGICTEQNIVLTEVQAKSKWSITDLMGVMNLSAMWYFSNYYYQSNSRNEWNNVALYGSDKRLMNISVDSDYDEIVTAEELESAWANGEAVSLPDINTVILHLPFYRQKLDLSLRLLRDEDENSASFRFPAFYVGIDSLCQLIPEFAERF